MTGNTLNKNERLKSRKSIESLFLTGKSISSPPFRLIYRRTELRPSKVQMTVAVPKRLIKKAVDRNLLKRRTREAYRLKKLEFLKSITKNEECIEILFLYQSSEISEYSTIKNSVNFLLIKLADNIVQAGK